MGSAHSEPPQNEAGLVPNEVFLERVGGHRGGSPNRAPFFFRGRLTGATYLEMLRNEVEEMLDDVPLNILRQCYWQQDGAPPHFEIHVRQYLNEKFGERWIGRGGPVAWPPRSPD